MHSEASIDPFFQEIPWEIIYDHNGKQIGEVFVLRGWSKSKRKRRAKKRGSTRRNQKGY
jgi:hypothetical protein